MSPLSLLAPALAALAAQDIGARVADGEAVTIDLRLDVAADLWYEARTLAAADGELPADHPLKDAAGAMRELEALLSSPEYWPVVDTFFVDTLIEVGFTASMTGPLRVRQRAEGVGRRMMAEAGLAVAQALDAASATWLEQAWPARLETLQERRAELRATFHRDVQWALFTDLRDWVRFPIPKNPHPVVLVTRLPGPGRAFLNHKSYAPAYVATEGHSSAHVAEEILHEVMHLVELSPFYPRSVFIVVDLRMAALDVPLEVRAEVVHLMHDFLAADMTRRHVDPEHTDNGNDDGTYARQEEWVEVVGPLWNAYIRGEYTSGQLTDAIAAGVAARIQGEEPAPSPPAEQDEGGEPRDGGGG